MTKGNGGSRRRENDAAGYRPRIVVKFHDFVALPYEKGAEGALDEVQRGAWSELAQEYDGLSLQPLFEEPKAEQIDELVERARERDRTYRAPNFLTYFAIECPPGVDPAEIAERLSAWRTVQEAYVEGGPTIPPAVNATDDPRSVNQGYLDPAPDGIDAEFGWTVAGGDGAGIAFVDLERGWTLNHEDLNAAGITVISGVNQDFFGHGTAVLGEVVAVDNTLGDVGIATAATARVVSQWRTSTTYSTSEAIMSAIATLGFGDVLLLEAQTTYPGVAGYLPVEVETAVFDAIRLGTALGIVIVEAAGNGSNDLDTFVTGTGAQVLNRASADFRDSGAIMVAAASSVAPHTPLGFTNFGSRIDCFGWGENIDTTGDGWTGNLTTSYTSGFGGTSGASPIVAGAALALQGMADANLGYRLSPGQLRAILADAANGTASAAPATDGIGVMPNLNSIVTNVLNLVPDVYVRDFVGDSGDPHVGAISASPDVILRQLAEPDPQTAFGEGSGTEASNMLGYEAEAGQDNYVYVRVRNRGGTGAAVTASVYWAPVATLVTPDLWTLVGTVSIPSVPTANQLTVSDAVVWPAAEIPASGHYCFVALIGAPGDPAPLLTDLENWNTFQLFIRENNNVTWRNFNVVNNVPPPRSSPPNLVPLPFLAPGAPDRARMMELEAVAQLPDGARAFLEAPLYLFDALSERSPYLELDGKGGVGRVPLNARGRLRLGPILFPARSRASLRLLVRIPPKFRDREFDIYVRQLFKGREVGRVTWRLSPRERTQERPRRPSQRKRQGRDQQ
jgi:serine protease